MADALVACLRGKPQIEGLAEDMLKHLMVRQDWLHTRMTREHRLLFVRSSQRRGSRMAMPRMHGNSRGVVALEGRRAVVKEEQEGVMMVEQEGREGH